MSTDIKKIFPGYQQLNPTGGGSTLVFSSPRTEGFLAGDTFSIKRDNADDAVVFSYSASPVSGNNEFSTLAELKDLVSAQYSDATVVVTNSELHITFDITGTPPSPSATQTNSGLQSSFDIAYDATPLGGVSIQDGNNVVAALSDGTSTSSANFKYQSVPATVEASANTGGITYTATANGPDGNGVAIEVVVTNGGNAQGQTKSIQVTEVDSTVTLNFATSNGYPGQAEVVGEKPSFQANDLKLEWNTEEEASVSNPEFTITENQPSDSVNVSGSTLEISLTDEIQDYTSTSLKAIIDAAGITEFSATDSSTQTEVKSSVAHDNVVYKSTATGSTGDNQEVVFVQNDLTVSGIEVSEVSGVLTITTDIAMSDYLVSDLQQAVTNATLTNFSVDFSSANSGDSLSFPTDTDSDDTADSLFTSGGVNAGTALSNWPNSASPITALQGGATAQAEIPSEAAITLVSYTLSEVLNSLSSSTLVVASLTDGSVGTDPFYSVADAAIYYPLTLSGGQAAGFSNAEQLVSKIVAHFSGLQVVAGNSTSIETIDFGTKSLSLSYLGTGLTSQDMFYISDSVLGYGASNYWGSIVGTTGSADPGESNSFNYTEKYIAFPLNDLIIGTNALTAEESNQISGDYRKVAYHFVRKIYEYLNDLEHISGLDIVAPGINYRSGDTIDFGDGVVATVSVDGNGSITEILYNGSSALSVNNPTPFGRQYNSAPNVSVTTSTGEGAVITASLTNLSPGKLEITKGTLQENSATGELTRPFSVTFTFNEQGLEIANEN